MHDGREEKKSNDTVCLKGAAFPLLLVDPVVCGALLEFLGLREIITLSLVCKKINILMDLPKHPVWFSVIVPNNPPLPPVRTAVQAYQLFCVSKVNRLEGYRKMHRIKDLRRMLRKPNVARPFDYSLSQRGIDFLAKNDGFTIEQAGLINGVVSEVRIRNLVNRRKTIDRGGDVTSNVRMVTSIDLWKFAYQQEAIMRWMHIGLNALLVILSYVLFFYSADVTHLLEEELHQYGGQSIKPNQASSLIFTDFCDVMREHLDARACRRTSYLYQQKFMYRWLAMFMLSLMGASAIVTICRFLLPIFNTKSGFQQAPLWSYLLPGCIHPSAIPFVALLRQPLVIKPINYEMMLHLRHRNVCVALYLLLFMVAASWMAMSISCYTKLLSIVTSDSAKELFEMVCLGNQQDQSLWSSCQNGNYIGDLVQPFQSYCVNICYAQEDPVHAPGEALDIAQAVSICAALLFLFIFICSLIFCVRFFFEGYRKMYNTWLAEFEAVSLTGLFTPALFYVPGTSDDQDDQIVNSFRSNLPV